MNAPTLVESGTMARVAYARVAPNEDLIQSVEKLCLTHGFKNAFVRGALGSLVDGCLLDAKSSYVRIPGPVEIVSIAGEVRSIEDGSLRAAMTGVIGDSQGNIFGGPFVAGMNLVAMTFEITLEEWVPEPPDATAQR